MIVEVREEEITVMEAVERLQKQGAGAIVSFAGIVRPEENGQTIHSIYYEAYVSMAKRKFEQIILECSSKGVIDVVVLHRTGVVPVGETSVVVAVSSFHRKEAFETCEKIMDRMKKEVPIWKKYTGEREEWHSAREKRE
ncbi:MAG: molybdenum cofactor biosynthesis protein MoaE [Methanomassiliicoccales archaeon]